MASVPSTGSSCTTVSASSRRRSINKRGSMVASRLARRRVSVRKKRRNRTAHLGRITASTPTPPPCPSVALETDGLSHPADGTRARRDEEPAQAEARLAKMRGAVRTLLECVGEDPDRPGLLATPARYAKALLFLTQGYQSDVRDVVNDALFRERHDSMVVVKDIQIHSLCEHHLVPFAGKIHIAYFPSDTLIGLSKLPRIAEVFARRLQLQERLTTQVANAIAALLSPRGVAVAVEARHLCMAMRGVEETSAATVTSCMLGCFAEDASLRSEFLSLVGVGKAGP